MVDELDLAAPFFACYLLCSQNPRFKGITYIGFTVNPRRRIRQHNGEITCGAFRTKKKRPWEMILCVYGFPSQVEALQFEWAWQHPRRSVVVREAATSVKSLRGSRGKVALLYAMLNLPKWNKLNLTINFLSTRHLTLTAKCSGLPPQMHIRVGPLEDLPCYASIVSDTEDDENVGMNADGSDTSSDDSPAPKIHIAKCQQKDQDLIESHQIGVISKNGLDKMGVSQTRKRKQTAGDDHTIFSEKVGEFIFTPEAKSSSDSENPHGVRSYVHCNRSLIGDFDATEVSCSCGMLSKLVSVSSCTLPLQSLSGPNTCLLKHIKSPEIISISSPEEGNNDDVRRPEILNVSSPEDGNKDEVVDLTESPVQQRCILY